MNTEKAELDRSRFELYINTRYFHNAHLLTRGEIGKEAYLVEWIQAAWNAWVAAKADAGAYK